MSIYCSVNHDIGKTHPTAFTITALADNFVPRLSLSSGSEYYQNTCKLELVGETRVYTDFCAVMFEAFSYLGIIYNKTRKNKQNKQKEKQKTESFPMHSISN